MLCDGRQEHFDWTPVFSYSLSIINPLFSNIELFVLISSSTFG